MFDRFGMAHQYISKGELVHRICNGFISHDGRVPHGGFVDLWKDNGYDVQSAEFDRIMEIIGMIIDSIPCKPFVEARVIENDRKEEFCGSCGHIIWKPGANGDVYCNNCGAKLIREE